MHDTHALTTRLAELLHREHAALADFLIALADFDRERRWLDLGHTSLFYFLHRELGLSKGAAFYRKTAAELVQRYPEVIEPLRQGKLCITSVVELAKVITPENRGEIVPRFLPRLEAGGQGGRGGAAACGGCAASRCRHRPAAGGEGYRAGAGADHRPRAARSGGSSG